MPRFGQESGAAATGFGFSAVDPGTLGATEYTLVSITVDTSGSTQAFQADMEKCVGAIVEGCRKSPRADNLLLRVTSFEHRLAEVHGFKELSQCNPGDYTNKFRPGGMTALYDALVDASDAQRRYGEDLYDKDMGVNAILVCMTDGCDNASAMSMGEVVKAFERAAKQEKLESVVTILIGVNVNDPTVGNALSDLSKRAGFSQYIELKDASAGTFAKIAGFVSRSISSQSQALNSGGPSKNLNF